MFNRSWVKQVKQNKSVDYNESILGMVKKVKHLVKYEIKIIMLKLNNIVDKSSTKKPKRVGRGIGSGKGKTSGAGHKGQKNLDLVFL